MPDELDRLIDQALSAHTKASDRPGLEHRVLANIQAHKPERRHRKFAYYAFVASAFIAAIWLWQPHTQTITPMPQLKQTPPPILIATSTPPPVVDRAIPKRRVIEPKKPQFPTPRPLTPQERALLEIAQSHPEQLATLNHPLEPLEVPEIKIDPLTKEEN